MSPREDELGLTDVATAVGDDARLVVGEDQLQARKHKHLLVALHVRVNVVYQSKCCFQRETAPTGAVLLCLAEGTVIPKLGGKPEVRSHIRISVTDDPVRAADQLGSSRSQCFLELSLFARLLRHDVLLD